ncbi:MAG: GHKL domain-containing protein [Bacteroidetes bacterium]|nr:MAG: GHKL domain-containing protein [Bacteroidota bacterium]
MQNALKKIKSNPRIKNGYLAGFTFLLIACLVTLYANRQLIRQSELVANTNKKVTTIEALLSQVKDAETGVRGYLVNHDSTFLEPYTGSKIIADSLFKILREQIGSNREQQNHLTELKTLVDERYFALEDNVIVYNRNSKRIIDSIYYIQVKGKRVMDNLRKKATLIQANEAGQLSRRDENLAQNFKALNIIIISTISIAVAILIFGFITHTKENQARRQAEKKIIDYQAELNSRIEDLHKANKELIQIRSQEKFAATGRIARTIAHEVRNPLTNINLATDQLKAEIINADENNSLLFEMINRNSHRINQLISDLLNSTKFSELTFNRISVNELLDETIKEAADRIALTNVKIIKKYSTDICDVTVDKERIKIAFLNIIINALEAMENRPDGKLIMETKGENDKCKIIFTDNGPGMDDESLSKLFEPYFTNKPNGNGLGLTNTQNIILNHKGDITVQSKRNGGTSFIITLDFAK